MVREIETYAEKEREKGKYRSDIKGKK